MASRRKGAATLAALMLLAGCDAGAKEADQAGEGNSSVAAIRSFATAMLDQRYTYNEYLERFSSTPPARRLRFQDHLVLAIEIPGLGSCFPRDNRGDLYGEPLQPGRERAVNEFRCMIDHDEFRLSDLRSFGRIYFNTAELGGSVIDVEDLVLPVGRHAELVGFESDPATGVSMEVVVVSDVDIFETARRAGAYPMLTEAVLDEIGDHITVRRIRFRRDDSQRYENTTPNCPSSGQESEDTISNSACL
jgi:hypothetical protein